MGEKVSAWLDKPFVSSTVAWIGLLGFMIGMLLLQYVSKPILTKEKTGLTANLVLRMWIGKAVDDFNRGITEQGQKGSPIVASVGNGFTSKYLQSLFMSKAELLSISS